MADPTSSAQATPPPATDATAPAAGVAADAPKAESVKAAPATDWEAEAKKLASENKKNAKALADLTSKYSNADTVLSKLTEVLTGGDKAKDPAAEAQAQIARAERATALAAKRSIELEVQSRVNAAGARVPAHVAKLLDLSALKFDFETGAVNGVESLDEQIAALKKDHGDTYFGQAKAPITTAPPTTTQPNLPKQPAVMTPEFALNADLAQVRAARSAMQSRNH